jgi:energy-coupling factor transporter ATP-binding protein EcfA2
MTPKPELLTDIQIEGFKSFERAHVELGTVNVFIGANGSGKSNLLEAIGVAGAAAFRSVEPEALRYRGVRPGLPALYKSSFAGRRIRPIISLECKSARALYRVGLNNPISTNDPGQWGISHELLESDGEKLVTRSPRGTRVQIGEHSLKASPPPRQTAASTVLELLDQGEDRPAEHLLQRLTDYAVYSPATAVLRGLAPDIGRPPLGLSGGSLPLAVKDLLNRRSGNFGPYDLDEVWDLIEWADDVRAVSSDQATISPAISTTPTVLRFEDRYMAPSRNTLSAYDASEGALYVLFLLALSAHPHAPPTFAVDNFDTALHPRLARALTRLVADQLISEGRRQVLLTTHNPLVLDGLDLLDDRVRLFAVERKDSGSSEVRRVEISKRVAAQLKKGVPLSRLWVMGRLGAVPEYL